MGGRAGDGHPAGRAGEALLLALIPATLFVAVLSAFYVRPLPWRWEWVWVPSLGINPALHIDGLSVLFLLLITGIGALVFVYSAGYHAGDPGRNRVFLLLLLFMAGMVGAVVSDHLLVLFVFWELTSVLSFLLIGTNHELEGDRKLAQQALLVTAGGGLCLLAGIILLGQIADTYSLQLLIERAPGFMSAPHLKAALGLIMLGAFAKSAQFPFHFWLPNAMGAPTPVSAYLHSATMVKLGIYLLARLDAAFSDQIFWEYTLIGVGTITAVLAAVRTVHERDLKRLLAWATVATLGTLTMLVGLPGHGGALATAALFLAHALYKAPLFFVAGNLGHATGTREIHQLRGLGRSLPWTAAAALMAAVSMAGLPLTFGFVAKDAITFAKAQAEVLQLVSYATVFVNGVVVAVATIAAIHVFWGGRTMPRRVRPHEVPPSMLLPPLLLVILGLIFGFAPLLVDPLLIAAGQAMAPGFDAMTVGAAYDVAQIVKALLGALLVGGTILLFWSRLGTLLTRARPLEKFGPEAWYWYLVKLLPVVAARQTRLLQSGRLPRYLLTLVGATTLALLGWLLQAPGPGWQWPAVHPLSAPVGGAALLITAGALAAIFVRDRLVLLLVSGLVGYGSAVLFLFTGAPDLAFTQFAIETVFVVVAAAVLLQLRRLASADRAELTEPRLRPLHLMVAIAFGGTLTTLVLLVSGLPFDNTLTEFFAAQSLPAAHGRNVVNLILVDFRALDTLGEIAVLAFSLLAALPLLRLTRRPPS